MDNVVCLSECDLQSIQQAQLMALDILQKLGQSDAE